jgi:hypothetical protein
VPLYPFASLAEVNQWQASFRAGGHAPWHLDPGQTALAFATWLGYSNVDAVIESKMDLTGANVSIGFRPTATKAVTSAVVHLVRWGTGPAVPWEVVGTDDTSFSLSIPPYGDTVSSPLRVAGRITGVDESIKIQVRDLQTSSLAGSYCCSPAGGTDTWWSAQVTFVVPSGTVLIIAAQTGGHVAAAERFAVTGVRSR